MVHDCRRQALTNVVWIGGSVCSGKTSAATILAERHALRAYHFDHQEPFHVYRSVPERQPHIIAFMAMTMDQRWVLRSPEDMAEQTIASWAEERFPMVVDDLIGLPGNATVVAEGAGLFPEKVAPLLIDERAAMWLVATDEFIRQVRITRGQSVAESTSNPERAVENLVARDVLIAKHVRQEAEARGLTVVEVDAELIADVPSIVEHQFAPLLRPLKKW